MKSKTSVTITEVAKLAGVSTATAGRVLGNYGYSSESKKKKVLEAAKRLGYRPNASARSLITGTTRTLGVVAGDLQSPFYAAILRGISDVADRAGFGVLITNSDEQSDQEMRAVELLRAKQVDGLIVSPCDTLQAKHLRRAVEDGVPLVLIDREVKNLEVDTIGAENVDSSRGCVRRLLEAGHRRIGLVAELVASEWDSLDAFTAAAVTGHIDERGLYPSWQRFYGYILAHRDAGIQVDTTLVRRAGAYSREAAERETNVLLSKPDGPTALFTTDGLMSAGAVAAITAHGLQIPRDLSICCFDDLDWMSFVATGLDAVAQPRRAMGEAAAKMILERVAGEDCVARRLKLTPKYIKRNSVVSPS